MFAAIVLMRVECDRIPEVAEHVADIDGVAEAYSVAGEWDVVAVLRLPEWDDISDVVTEGIATVAGVERTRTLTAFRSYGRGELEVA